MTRTGPRTIRWATYSLSSRRTTASPTSTPSHLAGTSPTRTRIPGTGSEPVRSTGSSSTAPPSPGLRPGPDRSNCQTISLLGWHPDAAVDADGLGVHVGIGHALDDHAGQLVGRTESLGVQHALAELGLERLGVLPLAVDRGVEQPWSDGVHADADGGEVTGHRQGHADDTALGCGVRRLADLAVEGCHAGHVDDGTTLAGLGRLVAGDRRTDEADAVEGADQVDRDHLGEGGEVRGGAELAVATDRALRPADAGRVDQNAHGPELLGLPDGSLDLFGLRDVDRREAAADLVREGLALLGIEVRDEDFLALRRKLTGDGCSDAGSAAGDDCTGSVDVHGRDTRTTRTSLIGW